MFKPSTIIKSEKGEGVSHIKGAFKDVESLKREEWHRRRLLRLEQVRQQSKDVANLVRQKVQSEREKQLGLVQHRLKAQTQQWQIKKLNALQKEYKNTLQNVGKGHNDAACQPSANALKKIEAEKIMAAAQRRGQEALTRLKEEEAARSKTEEERRNLLSSVKAMEEARSAAVVALPCPNSTVVPKSLPLKKPVNVYIPVSKSQSKPVSVNTKNALPEWPKKDWPRPVLPLGILATESDIEQGDSVRPNPRKVDELYGLQEANISMSVASHGDTFEGRKITVAGKTSPQSSKINKLSCSSNCQTLTTNTDVKLYDYTSCYQSQYNKVSGIAEKVQVEGQINAKEAADKEVSATPSFKPSSLRTQKRCQEALRKVHVQRDYKELMGSLSVLAKQNAALSVYRKNPGRPVFKDKSQEEHLLLAFENLLPDALVEVSDNADLHLDNTPDASLVVSQTGDTPSSVPRLNLGRWHPVDTTEGQILALKPDSSPTDSIITAPPFASEIHLISRQDNSERDHALRNLVQRINNERQLLLQPGLILPDQQPQTHVRMPLPENHEQEIRLLEKRVLQQRELLEQQRSEVKSLDASIVVPDCNRQPVKTQSSPQGSTLSHESIIIEQSPSDESTKNSVSLPSASPKKMQKKDENSQSKISMKDPSSPKKESKMYSMDVSLSSLIMDQTENDSSGSKSLSLHGVQVVVKVCERDVSDASDSVSSEYSGMQKGLEIKEIIEESVTHDAEVQSVKHDATANVPKKKEGVKDSHQFRHADKQSKKTGKTYGSTLKAKHGATRQGVRQNPRKTSLLIKTGEGTVKEENMEMRKQEPKSKKRRKRADEEENDQPVSTSTSYLSPPDQVLSSLTEDIKALIALAQANSKQPHSGRLVQDHTPQNQVLASYINRLLAMSRESIDRLNVSCSDVSTPPSALFQSSCSADETNFNITDVGLHVPEQEAALPSISNNDKVDFPTSFHKAQDPEDFQNVYNDVPPKVEADKPLLGSMPDDQEALLDMTKVCHENILALTRMIKEVREEGLANLHAPIDLEQTCTSQNHSTSTIHLDSTAYMSPPPEVLEWAYIPQSEEGVQLDDSKMSSDPYGIALMHLISDIRNQEASKQRKPDHFNPAPKESAPYKLKDMIFSDVGRPKPPVTFWKNIERCNVTSPTEPHELSTIHELATTLPESEGSPDPAPASPPRFISGSSSPGTPPDVIAELMRRNLLTSPFAWAKKMNHHLCTTDPNAPPKTSQESDLSSCKTVAVESDVSTSKETNSSSMQSQNSSSNESRHWKTNFLMTPVDLYSSADDVEGDFRRLGIGWVGAMLRKTKEAGALSSTSSSEGVPTITNSSGLNDISGMVNEEPILGSSLLVTRGQSRGHSTPIKPRLDTSSSSS